MRSPKSPRIDAHHHLWQYSPVEYGWISDEMAVLQRDFLPDDLNREIQAAGVSGAVAVQARQTLGETEWLLGLAEQNDFMLGVVGWVPLADPGLPAILERLAARPKLKGVRHVVQDEPDDNFILREDINAGVSALNRASLVYDILIFERHLPQAIAFVDRHPDQPFVLDHVAKPRITTGEISPWKERIAELARRPNICCKLSGMVTEADWGNWTEEQLQPYMETVLEAFGPSRLMFGSDWPVCLLATEYARWFELVSRFVRRLSADEQAEVLGGTAARIYNLGDYRS